MSKYRVAVVLEAENPVEALQQVIFNYAYDLSKLVENVEVETWDY